MSAATPGQPSGPPVQLEQAAAPAGDAVPAAECEVSNLTIAYRTEGIWPRAVREVSFEVRPGETLAIVGETGSGKSSAAQAIMRLLPAAGRIESGAVRVRGTDVLTLSDRGLREVRGKLIGYVPQQPSAAFNPVMTIGRQVAEALVIHEGVRYKDAVSVVMQTLAEMGLEDPAAWCRPIRTSCPAACCSAR